MTGHMTAAAAAAGHDERSAAVREVARVEAICRKVTTGEPGRRIMWRIWGSGDPVVLLHGGFGSWTHWIKNVEPLSRNAMVLAPDMPGFGDSDSLPDQAGARPFAEALWDGLDTLLGDERRVALVGFSFGGPIAGAMAHIRADQVSRLVLVGSGGLKLSRPDTEPLSRWRALAEPNEILEAHRRNLKILMIHNHRRVDALAVYLQAANAGRARAASRPVSRGTDLPSLLGAIDVPIAGIWGFHDATAAGFLHERESLLRRLDSGAEFIVIEGAGHWVQYEAAKQFNEALKRILAARRTRGRDEDEHQGERNMSNASPAGNSTDEMQIKAMLQRYFYALDARDREVLETCFAEDVEVQYHTGTAGQFTQDTARSIVDYLIDNMQNYKARTHVGANMHVWVKGETATSVTHAVATLLKGERLVIRGLRYTDEHTKIAGEWRISRRKHQPLWQYEATPMQPDIPAPALKLAAAQARK